MPGKSLAEYESLTHAKVREGRGTCVDISANNELHSADEVNPKDDGLDIIRIRSFFATPNPTGRFHRYSDIKTRVRRSHSYRHGRVSEGVHSLPVAKFMPKGWEEVDLNRSTGSAVWGFS